MSTLSKQLGLAGLPHHAKIMDACDEHGIVEEYWAFAQTASPEEGIIALVRIAALLGHKSPEAHEALLALALEKAPGVGAERPDPAGEFCS